jgi:hypothetical protein
MGGFIAVAVFELAAGSFAAAVVGFAINMVATMIIAKVFAPNAPSQNSAEAQPNVGNRQQLPPAGDNKLPVIYGSAYVGGVIVDLSITSNNQDLYWVFALSEVTNSENGNTPDVFTFGNVYWGGKKVIFGTGAAVTGLQDESTGLVQDITGYMDVYLYRNGSNTPTNSSVSAISVMQASGLVYKWDSTKLMSNCAFAIIHVKYSQSRNLTGLGQTRFQVNNPRNSAGDCIKDYLTSTRYGAAIALSNIDTTSITALNTYSNASFTYTNYSGVTSTQPRFKFNGALDTNTKIMVNIQNMADSCDCLIRYSEINSLWGVIVQTPTNTIAMNINDSNMVSAISVTPIDLSNSFNVIEVKFPDGSAKDSFNSATFDLAVINPSLMFPNEPVNKQSVSLYLCNNNVQAQYLANRFLEAAREDLQLTVDIDYTGLQLDAGDIVTVTNANYGWVAKQFRIGKVTQKFSDSGQVTAGLSLMEFNGAVYDDRSITQFTPSPNTGIGSPITFGVVTAPTITTLSPNDANPSFSVGITTSSAGITQYAEVWYSAFQYPTSTQMMLIGTTAINANGDPYGLSEAMPAVQLFNIPAGNWYFFSRMVNQLAKSDYSLASTVLHWQPTTYGYFDRYLSIAYANDLVGTGFTFNPRGKSYYGLLNQSNSTPSSVASNYNWYLANPTFGTNNFLLYAKRANRNFSFAQGLAGYASGTASFVPTQTATFDPSIWSGLIDGTNIIDLDQRTGQLLGTGTTTVGTGEIAIINNPNGSIVASLQEYLDFGGAYTKTVSVGTITIDIYGRVVGFSTPDDFYYTENTFIATSGQTVFNVTRGAGYIPNQCFVFKNGVILNPSEYTDNTTNITLSIGATLNDVVMIIAFKSVDSTSAVYASFTRDATTLTNQSSYTASGFTLYNGFELLFLNGTIVTAQDYSISGQTITFAGNTTGDLQIVQWTPNNLGVANGTPVNVDAFTVIGQTVYNFNFNASAFNLYSNGVILTNTLDYTEATNQYTLANIPSTIDTIMVQQTFSRTGAV